MMKRYSELIQLKTFDERFAYLQLNGAVGVETFGEDRYLNQAFYTSDEWRSIRNEIIVRDNGCDLGVDGYTIHGKIYIHHLNPICQKDVLEHSFKLIDPDNLICTSFSTHNAIHYGNEEYAKKTHVVERQPGDTNLWTRRRIIT